MATIYEQAHAALEAQASAKTEEALGALTALGLDTTGLTVAHREVTDNGAQVVFTDGAHHLAATQTNEEWAIHLVQKRGGWTRVSRQLRGLVDLALALGDVPGGADR